MLALIVLAGRAFATDPLTDAVASMKATANSSYAGADPVQDTGVPSRLRTSTFTARLGQAQGLLQAAGCTVDADLFLSGAYRSNAVSGTTGESESGTLLDATLSTEPKAIIGSLGATPVGDTIGVWNSQARFVANEGSDFYVGQAARVQGTRGVFMGLKARCPLGTSPGTALATWYTGDLTGLDPWLFSPSIPVNGQPLVVNDRLAIPLAQRVSSRVVWLIDGSSRLLDRGEIIAVCPGFGAPSECPHESSISDVFEPITILGKDVGVCAFSGDGVTIVLDGGASTLFDLGLIPTVHSSYSTLHRGPGAFTYHPSIDFGSIFDGCP